jgi:hypothetical protein
MVFALRRVWLYLGTIDTDPQAGIRRGGLSDGSSRVAVQAMARERPLKRRKEKEKD